LETWLDSEGKPSYWEVEGVETIEEEKKLENPAGQEAEQKGPGKESVVRRHKEKKKKTGKTGDDP